MIANDLKARNWFNCDVESLSTRIRRQWTKISNSFGVCVICSMTIAIISNNFQIILGSPRPLILCGMLATSKIKILEMVSNLEEK
jgi:hypothetical protein